MARFLFTLNGKRIRSMDDFSRSFESAPYDVVDRFQSGALVRWLEEMDEHDTLKRLRAIHGSKDMTKVQDLFPKIGAIFGFDEQKMAKLIRITDRQLFLPKEITGMTALKDPDVKKRMTDTFSDSQDHDRNLDRLQKLAEEDGPIAYRTMWYLYHLGIGVDQDDEQAFSWAEKASEQFPDMKFFVGLCYFYGNGVEKDEDKGKKAIEEAKKKGSIDAERWIDWEQNPDSVLKKRFRQAVRNDERIQCICKKIPEGFWTGMSTWGGHVWWSNLAESRQWRLQQNPFSGICRILDPSDIRRAYGSLEDIRKAFSEETELDDPAETGEGQP